MAVMNTSVKWIHSGMQGAPVIDNNWGALTAMLRACCVTGFNVRPVQGITCEGTVATIQCAGHGFVEHQVVRIEGAVPSAYNGDHRVIAITGANTLTIELAEQQAPAQAAPGQTLQMRAAPLGFESLFDNGGQKLVLRSTDPQSTRNVLRVDDSCPVGYTTTWAKFGRVTMAQDMSDLDTFIGVRAPFDPADPTKNEVPQGSGSSMRSGWFKWHYAMSSLTAFSESAQAQAGVRTWWVFGDGRGFYLGVCPVSGGNVQAPVWSFGDVDGLQTPDAFATALCATEHQVVSATIGQQGTGNLANGSVAGGRVLLRDYTGEGAPVGFIQRSLDVRQGIASNASYSGLADSGVPYPNGPGNGLLVHPVWLQQGNGHLRGKMRGFYYVLHKQSLGHLAVVDVTGLPGRKVILVNVMARGTGSGDSEMGSVAFDITGPW